MKFWSRSSRYKTLNYKQIVEELLCLKDFTKTLVRHNIFPCKIALEKTF
jgi:hypothetical protein